MDPKAAFGLGTSTTPQLRGDHAPCLFLESHIETKGYVSIVAEAFRPQYILIRPALASLAEPISRPPLMHEYHLTPFSLGAAVSNGVTPEEAIAFFDAHCYGFSTTDNTHSITCTFIRSCMSRYNLARVVIENERTMVQCQDEATAQMLLSDFVIRALTVQPTEIRYELVSWRGVAREYPCFLLQSRAMAKIVASRCVVLGLPIQQQYDFERDTTIRAAHMMLRSQTKPRRYQVEAVEAAVTDGVLSSGCLLLPCGAGKTLLGIMLMCKVKKPTLVVCAGAVSVEQWKNQIVEYAVLLPPAQADEGASIHKPTHLQQRRGRAGAARIACLTGKQKDDIDEDTDVVLTTYSMLASAHRTYARRRATASSSSSVAGTMESTSAGFTEHGTRKRKPNPKDQLFQPFGLMILDEVHVIPADSFRESLSFIDVKGVIGLTATYVREDKKILDLFHLVGPKLYDISMETLAAQGYLAKVNCVEVHTPMTREFGLEYVERSVRSGQTQKGPGHVPALVMLAAANPNKMVCVQELVRRHRVAGAKILVFCDHIMLLQEYGRVLGVPVISGSTPHRDRLMLFSDFQSTSKVNVLCISRVGDVSVNLPSANVVVQVSSHGGSRRQEAQRLGRILRPKERAANGQTADAWFYSVISMGTLEMGYAAHRTAFLVDQGYTCRIMEFHPDEEPQEKNANEQVKKCPTADEQVLSSGTGVVKAQDTAVGDAATIKVEIAEGAQRHAGVLRQTRSTALATPGTLAEIVRTLPYQLGLLSKVVSSWELEFQKECRTKRDGKNDDDEQSAAIEGGDSGDDDVLEVAAPDRTYGLIKREWLSRVSVGDEGAEGPVALGDLIGVDDGFVYHEL